MKLDVLVGDISRLDVDVIVNAANPALVRGGGVCGAIHEAAGPALQNACFAEYPMGIHTGEAVHTEGCALRAKWVIHTAGPIFDLKDVKIGEALLRQCYTNSLNLADKLEANTIAFPLISSGIYGFSLIYASEIAVSAIREWMHTHAPSHLTTIYLVAYNNEALFALKSALSVIHRDTVAL